MHTFEGWKRYEVRFIILMITRRPLGLFLFLLQWSFGKGVYTVHKGVGCSRSHRATWDIQVTSPTTFYSIFPVLMLFCQLLPNFISITIFSFDKKILIRSSHCLCLYYLNHQPISKTLSKNNTNKSKPHNKFLRLFTIIIQYNFWNNVLICHEQCTLSRNSITI